MYRSLNDANFKIDVRTFKGKKAFCPEQTCHYSKKGFDIRVQAEVDVAIAMVPVKVIHEHSDLKVVLLLTGDGDFHDMVDFMQKTHGVKVVVVSWKGTVNQSLEKMCTGMIWLDEIWDQISILKGNNNIKAMTNYELLKELGFVEAVAKAASHRYPNKKEKE